MNSLKLLTLSAVLAGLVAGSSLGQAGPALQDAKPSAIDTSPDQGVPELGVGLGLGLAGRLVVASADSGYRPAAGGGGLRRQQ